MFFWIIAAYGSSNSLGKIEHQHRSCYKCSPLHRPTASSVQTILEAPYSRVSYFLESTDATSWVEWLSGNDVIQPQLV
ncbi:hypothetical protein EMIT0P253_10255 [Pseudomonas sp. IT-P253]